MIRYGINYKINKKIKELDNLIPKTNHTLFILVDGMGSNLINTLEDKSILKRNLKKELLTVSPSTTACVLTSIATGEFPIHHGVIGWYSHNKEKQVDYYPLLFSDRENLQSLDNYNITPNEIYKIPSVFNKLTVNTNVLYPNNICNSVYSNYVANDSIRNPYKSLNDAYKQIKEIVRSTKETFTYLYIPTIDELEHDYGVNSKEVLKEIKNIESFLQKLQKEKDLTIVITADHGQINIKNDIIMDFDLYNNYFYGLPGIDFGMATYYIKEDKRQEFETRFQKDFQDKMYLFKTEEFLTKKIFGNTKKTPYMKESLGEYISICKNGYCFVNSTDINEYIGKTAGNHSGLSKDEMLIPLIIINTNNL